MLYEAIVNAVDSLPRKESRLILDYFGLERYENRFKDIESVSKEILAARLHIGKVQAVDENALRAVAILRVKLEESGWIEGKYTPITTDKYKEDTLDLTDIDCGIIEYAVHKWRKSGKPTDFYMLFRKDSIAGERFVREFLKMWLYG